MLLTKEKNPWKTESDGGGGAALLYSGCEVIFLGAEHIVAPVLARITHRIAIHCLTERISPRNTKPDNAPKAGWRLWRTLNVFAGTCFRENRSSENGSALEKTPTPRPISSSFRSSASRSPLKMPKGRMNKKAMHIPVVTASELFIRAVILPPITI